MDYVQRLRHNRRDPARVTVCPQQEKTYLLSYDKKRSRKVCTNAFYCALREGRAEIVFQKTVDFLPYLWYPYNMVTIYDIAQESGFAAGTVSKALNNYYGVNKETKRKILEVARKMGYTPNANARALKAKYSQNLGILFYLRDSLDLSQYFFIEILNAFKRKAELCGYDITLLAKGGDYSAEAFVKHCRIRQLDGVLIFGDYGSDLVKELMHSEIPCVGFDYLGNEISGITSDNYEKTKELVLKLIEMGHERILFLTGEENFVTSERTRGYADAFREAGMDRLSCVRASYSNPELSRKLTKELVPALKPTAILYPDDFSATGGLNAIRELGLSVPRDISIASFDGSVFSEITSPKLTGLRQDAVGIGNALAEKLIRLVTSEKEKNGITVVPASVRITESCGPAKRN